MVYITEEKFNDLIKKFTPYVKCDRNDTTAYDLFTTQLDEVGYCKSRLQFEVSTAELSLKRAEAVAYIDIKNNPEKFGLNKVSETAIKILIDNHPEVIKASDQFINSNYYFDRISALYSALFSKRTWLEIQEKNTQASIGKY